MSSELRLRYRPGLDATPKAELDALVAVYAFLLRRNGAKATEVGGGPDIEGGEEGSPTETPTG